MANFNVDELFSKYPEIITEMDETFTSHEFILKLANKYQVLYIEALYAYRYKNSGQIDHAPFKRVHVQLAKQLRKRPDLVEYLRDDAPSVDIFGNRSSCAEWRKIT